MEKALSRNEVRRRAQKFATRWKGTKYEKGESQSFWNDFLTVFGIDRKRVNASFEHAVTKSSTNKIGFIDMFWPGILLVEQKSEGKDLDKATFQALDYLPNIPNHQLPRALVMSDFRTIRIKRLDGDGTTTTETFETVDLAKEIDRFGFLTDQRDKIIAAEVKANQKAVALMGELYEELASTGYDEHETSVMMVRLLFLFFGDDTGLWKRGQFHDFISKRTVPDGTDTGPQLASLFQVLDRAVDKRSPHLDDALNAFPYVNGGLFSEHVGIASFSPEMRGKLLKASEFDWGQISPAIFGSMFQTVRNDEERRAGGEHYTSEENILKTIRPLFLDDLREKFLSCGTNQTALEAFHKTLGRFQFLDPACGCGNFLLLAYRELRDLELEVMLKLRDITGQSVMAAIDYVHLLRVSPKQFHGLEIDEWPAKIAEAAFFMVDHQANLKFAEEFGEMPERLPITITADIRNVNALHQDWAEVVPATKDTIVFGNPPFNGARTVTKDQRKDMEAVWKKDLNANFDFVTAWYKKALDFYGDVDGQWAFVSTNSICQGEPVADLWRPILDANWRCRFAHRSLKWDSEARGKAGVTVSIVGFDRKKSPKPVLWEYSEGGSGDGVPVEATRINPYLIDGPNILVRARKKEGPLHPGLPPAILGHRAIDGGGLFLNQDDYDRVSTDPVVMKYVRPFLGASELLYDTPRWCLWMLNFNPADVASSAFLQERLGRVRDFRLSRTNKATREAADAPQRFGIIAPSDKFDLGAKYLAIPRHVGERRPYFFAKYTDPSTITGDANCIASDPDGYGLGILSSSMFIAWMKAIGGRLETRLRFSSTYTYNTFPMPAATQKQRDAVVAAAQLVIKARENHPGVCLADLYNPLAMPLELVKAHQAVDRAVDKIFRTEAPLSTVEDRQKVLFRSYAKLTNHEELLLESERLSLAY
ncbi:class I SAM-dependent DNA methyltransferase [Pseudarthrobacter sp. NPDC092184]